MLSSGELGFLRDTLKKCHIDTEIIKPGEIKKKIAERIPDFISGKSYDDTSLKITVPTKLERKTVYKLTDSFGFSYTYFLISEGSDDDVLIIGPYVHERPSESKISEYAEKNSLSVKHGRYLAEYYAGITVIDRGSFIFTMLSSFCERRWKTASFAIVDINDEYSSPASPISNTPKEENFDELLADMKTMEKRYKYENELIEAVTLGQTHKESFFIASFNELMFEKRVPDLLQNARNYCIIMNTLLRKAAENGGVHPVYIDRVSGDFALKIECLSLPSDTAMLMKDMFKTYCRLVQKHTMNGYSELVKNTVLLIDSDISAPISPSALAKTHNVSLGYLSTLFRKETGKTLTEYIKDRRISHAKHLLKTTQLQVQTIALHCGILDLQYFSKCFKKNTGQTPKQYRESKKQENKG